MPIPWRKIGRFAAVGGGVTGLNYILYTSMISAGVHYLIAVTIGWVIGTSISFIGNKYWTFMREGAPEAGEIGRFVTGAVLQLVLGTASIVTLVDVLGIDTQPAFFLNVGITALFSYVFLDQLVFPARALTKAFSPRSEARQDG